MQKIRGITLLSFSLALVGLIPLLGLSGIIFALPFLITALALNRLASMTIYTSEENPYQHDRIILNITVILILLGLILNSLVIINIWWGRPVPALHLGWEQPRGSFPLGFRILGWCVLLFSVMLHESAHGLVAYWCGDPTAKELGRISLNPLKHLSLLGSVILPLIMVWTTGFIFGWAKPVPVAPHRTASPDRTHLLVALAGPATNFILALVFFGLLVIIGSFLSIFTSLEIKHFASILNIVEISEGVAGNILAWVIQTLKIGMILNIVLGCFNLMPFPPLDGAWIVEKLLPTSLGWIIRTLRSYLPISILLGIISGVITIFVVIFFLSIILQFVLVVTTHLP